MPFVSGTDFDCSSLHSVFICKATQPLATTAYTLLQKQVKYVATEMAKVRTDVPATLSTLVVDGRVGPTTALGAQVVLAAFQRTVPLPESLAPVLAPGASTEDAVTSVAVLAPEITAYIAGVLKDHPEALRALVVEKVIDKWKSRISLKAMLIAGGGIAALVGVAIIARKMERQRAGVEDGSHFLPPGDEDDDEDDDEEDGE